MPGNFFSNRIKFFLYIRVQRIPDIAEVDATRRLGLRQLAGRLNVVVAWPVSSKDLVVEVPDFLDIAEFDACRTRYNGP